MPSVFTVRDRILLHLLDQGKDKWVRRSDICEAIGTKSGNACCVFKELLDDGCLVVRRSKGVKGGGTMEFCITEKGLSIAMTQVWRMRNVGVKALQLLPPSQFGRKPKAVVAQ
jgi:predicted transcriptional regulator